MFSLKLFDGICDVFDVFNDLFSGLNDLSDCFDEFWNDVYNLLFINNVDGFYDSFDSFFTIGLTVSR